MAAPYTVLNQPYPYEDLTNHSVILFARKWRTRERFSTNLLIITTDTFALISDSRTHGSPD
jgi:hypothetical protein